MLERRCAQAGLVKVHPHQFRHTAAHTWLAAGGSEVSAMRNFGWAAERCCPGTEPVWLTSGHGTSPPASPGRPAVKSWNALHGSVGRRGS